MYINSMYTYIINYLLYVYTYVHTVCLYTYIYLKILTLYAMVPSLLDYRSAYTRGTASCGAWPLARALSGENSTAAVSEYDTTPEKYCHAELRAMLRDSILHIYSVQPIAFHALIRSDIIINYSIININFAK